MFKSKFKLTLALFHNNSKVKEIKISKNSYQIIIKFQIMIEKKMNIITMYVIALLLRLHLKLMLRLTKSELFQFSKIKVTKSL